ncbi:MAG TPA: family 20 glycosylhydrolase, partial [Cyclobacteriaceae bacterium]|nr:family 20 glycosylhydrolase [Cyclobacteriaceae bacterium]
MKKLIIFSFIAFLVIAGGCAQKTGSVNDPAVSENDLIVTWELISNITGEPYSAKAAFTIENNSKYTLAGKGWAMYFNMFSTDFKKGTESQPVSLENLGGDFCRMVPKESFSLEAGETVTIEYSTGGVMIKNTDAPLGLYFVFDDMSDKEVLRVKVNNYTIVPFTRPEQINRSENDRVPIPDAQFLYNEYRSIGRLNPEDLPPFLPAPKSYVYRDGNAVINASTVIHFGSGLEKEASYLARNLKKLLGTDMKIEASGLSGSGIITLKTAPVSVNGLNKEAYILDVSSTGGMIITGSDASGVFYGAVSLLGMAPVDAFKNSEQEISLRAVSVKDAAAMSYRGMHLDVTRNFFKKATILKLIDVMALYKLNRLHLHLTDDEGWRLEIRGLPELTGIGSKRGHTLTDEEYLHPSYGSGPDPDPEKSYGTGYYSREDYKEILTYAGLHHIDVIPEIEMPGHARAAIKAMESRYRKLMAEGKESQAEEYRLIDPEDKSEYTSAQNYHDNVVCVTRESVYRFYEIALDDIIAMHKEAGVPLAMFQVAGDEVPEGSWTKSPMAMEFLKNNPSLQSARDLQPYFFRKIVKMIEDKGIPIGGWEEMAMKPEGEGWIPNPEFANKQIYPFVWNSLRGNMDLGYKLANGGYPVILCNVTNYYFDMAYNKDPREPGLYWGGFVNTKNAFRFAPYDIYQAVLEDPSGEKLTAEDFAKYEKLNPAAKKNIVGLQAQLWSETIKGQDMLEYDYLPKMLGLAWNAWNGTPAWSLAG